MKKKFEKGWAKINFIDYLPDFRRIIIKQIYNISIKGVMKKRRVKMETKDHLALARLITFSNKSFSKSYRSAAFETGCISPDINFLTYIKGHTYKGTISYVKKTVSKLQNKLKTVSDYYELGRIIHFIADYFTFPHSPDFTGTLKQHVEYESLFHKYIEAINGIDYNKSINDVKCKASCVSMIESAHEKYLGMKHNFQTDWQFISSVCIEVTDAVTSRNSISAKSKYSSQPLCGSI